MNAPADFTPPLQRSPLREAITALSRRAEPELLPGLLDAARLEPDAAAAAQALALKLAGTLRERKLAFSRAGWSRTNAQGCQMIEGQVRLDGWSRTRRVVIVRQRVRGGIARERRIEHSRQLQLDLEPVVFQAGDKLWEYGVLVTDVDCPIESVAQLYRDPADAENAFDELKNQWGLSGFTTQDINRSLTMARSCSLVYNWWSWYCRAAHRGARMEAITSRPLMLAAVGKAVNHANQTTLYLTLLHGKAQVLKTLIANIGETL